MLSKLPLPNLIIAGVVKGGTTSLYTCLSQHPEICCSTVKETCYFLTYRYGKLDNRYLNTIDPYKQFQSYFKHCHNQKYRMEATPGYFEGGKKVAQEIKKQLGEQVKIIIILRKPTERLISFFKYKKSMLAINKHLSLEQYIEQCQQLAFEERLKPENDTYWAIDGGFYANYLHDWFDVFGSNIKILFFDDLKNNHLLLLKDLCDWLNIETNCFDLNSLAVENKSRNYKNQYLQKIALFVNLKAEKFWRSHSQIKRILRGIYFYFNGSIFEDKISDNTLNFLENLYLPYNKKLAKQLLNQGYTKLPSWLQF